MPWTSRPRAHRLSWKRLERAVAQQQQGIYHRTGKTCGLVGRSAPNGDGSSAPPDADGDRRSIARPGRDSSPVNLRHSSCTTHSHRIGPIYMYSGETSQKKFITGRRRIPAVDLRARTCVSFWVWQVTCPAQPMGLLGGGGGLAAAPTKQCKLPGTWGQGVWVRVIRSPPWTADAWYVHHLQFQSIYIYIY